MKRETRNVKQSQWVIRNGLQFTFHVSRFTLIPVDGLG
jgi:hypothetical protein